MKKGIAAILVLMTLLGMAMTPVSLAEEVPAGDYGVHYVKYGDANFDEKVDATDALMALQHAVQKITLDDIKVAALDVNQDKEVNATDALMILKLSVGKLSAFSAGVYYIIQEVGGEPVPPDDPIVTGNYIMDFDKSNSTNGAYEKDITADTSFVIDTSSLQANTVYRLSGGALKDQAGVSTLDYQRLIYSLQGLVNRDFGMDEDHSSIMYVLSDLSDANWLEQITAEGEIMHGLSEVKIANWDTFYNNFKGVIKSCGIVLWDGNVPATANVAATICGVDGYLPVLANSPLHKALAADGVPVKQSLVGLFKNGQKGTAITGTNIASTGSAKNDAYLWALDKYFNRCSSQYLAYILDGAITLKGYSDYGYSDHPTALLGGNNCLMNHDYLIARRCFFFDLAPYKGEAACDDPAQKNGQAAIGTDNATMIKIFQARYDRANGAFGALMGFPPWWCKYTSEQSQGSKLNTWIEWLYCEYITCYNLAKEADAQAPASMTNGSAFYKYVPHTSQYTNNTASQNITYDKDTFYYTIYVGDYDSSAWLKEHIYAMWVQRGGDKKRGTLPLMWSINPNLADRVPMIFDYMYENMTDMDYFAGGDGGAGYIIPEGLFQDKALAYTGEKRANASGGGIFAAYSKKYYDRFGMENTGFIINGSQHSITPNIADCISRYSPKLNFTNCFNTRVCKYGSTYFVYCHNGVGTNSQADMYNHAVTTKNAGYNFSAFRTVCLTPTEISGIVTSFDTYASGKGMKVKYVDPYTYYNLLKASGQGTSLGTASTPSTLETPTPDAYIPPDPNVLVPFDSTSGVTSAFSTTVAIETNNKTEGSGALHMAFGNPTGQSATTKIGGMACYEFTAPVDLTSATGFTLDYWLTDAIVGSAGLQINFVTNGKDDGYNYMVGINNAKSGWHTITIDKSKPSATANNPDWSSIRAIRITYFNYANNAKPTFMMIDNVRKVTDDSSTTPTPEPTPEPTPTTAKVLLNFDSTSQYSSNYETSLSVETTNKNEGSGSMRLGFGNPTGDSAGNKIGGMVTYDFGGTVDLSAATTFTLDYWIPEKLVGTAGLQINFVTNGKNDGYNFTMGIDNATAGWHTLTIDKSKPSATANSPDWSSIQAIRITYFNYANNATPAFMLLDNLTVDADFTLTEAATSILVNFDSTANVTTAFSTTVAIEANNKQEGSGSMRMGFGDPTGQAAGTQIGGMAYYEFTTPVDLSAVKTMALDYWVPETIAGSAGLQINFVTNGKDDGYNFIKAINGATAGWNTITLNKSKPSATANTPDWSSIRAIRITYFNYANSATPAFMLVDNLKITY